MSSKTVKVTKLRGAPYKDHVACQNFRTCWLTIANDKQANNIALTNQLCDRIAGEIGAMGLQRRLRQFGVTLEAYVHKDLKLNAESFAITWPCCF